MENSAQGLQNQVGILAPLGTDRSSNFQQMFAIFVFLFVVFQLVYQIMPNFVVQRTLYEARERQSKTYMWQAFLFSNIVIEMFWNIVSQDFASVLQRFVLLIMRRSWPSSAFWYGSIL